MASPTKGEGGLSRPIRHPVQWKTEDYYKEDLIFNELERVFDICHGCRRCFNLCQSFPILFDAIDEGDTGELDAVNKKDYWKVINNCYLCDMCFMTKCPYVPPHEWNIDFPALMLRAKAYKFKKMSVPFRDKMISNTNLMGKMNSLPLIAPIVNAMNHFKPFRWLMDKTMGIASNAPLPAFDSRPLRKRMTRLDPSHITPQATDQTKGKVVLFATCYANYNYPQLGEDLIAVYEHNGIPVRFLDKEECCGMPKYEMGDIESVAKAMEQNAPHLIKCIDEGWDIVAPMPSCVFMLKEIWPLLFPDDPRVKKISERTYDPFEYLMLRHKGNKLKTDFKKSLGEITYHVSCHLRAQNIGMKTREFLSLIDDTKIDPIERCSGHDGTYALKSEYRSHSMKICKPVIDKVKQQKADYYASDCHMAGVQIESGLKDGSHATHPMTLARMAYGI
ncbi:MAG: ferredoxin [bacterium]|nr:MAG: ferredoxin [bacterium]